MLRVVCAVLAILCGLVAGFGVVDTDVVKVLAVGVVSAGVGLVVP